MSLDWDLRKKVWFSCTRVGWSGCLVFGCVLAEWCIGFMFARWLVFFGPHFAPKDGGA